MWKTTIWPSDWKKSIFIPLFKKGDRQDCANYRTIALISHTSKVLLKVIQNRLSDFLSRHIPREQAGFRQGRGTRDHIANIRWIIELARERRKSVYFAFIDYTKAFDSVDHELLWSTLNSMGAPRHTISLLKNLYANQEAQVRLELGETKWFRISKGARQGCILSPSLFNLYAEMIIRNALGDNETGVKIGGQTISNLRYADDTTILAGTSADLKLLQLSRVHHFERRQLYP